MFLTTNKQRYLITKAASQHTDHAHSLGAGAREMTQCSRGGFDSRSKESLRHLVLKMKPNNTNLQWFSVTPLKINTMKNEKKKKFYINVFKCYVAFNINNCHYK